MRRKGPEPVSSITPLSHSFPAPTTPTLHYSITPSPYFPVAHGRWRKSTPNHRNQLGKQGPALRVSVTTMDKALLQRFQHLLAQHTGLNLRPHDEDQFRATLLSRIKALRLDGPPDYYRLLTEDDPRAEAEWKYLATRVTNRESYFFRDQGQMALLRDQLLPALIERRRRTLTLRLWSAGCSTGEEPYSLAMLVSELLPRREHWQITILGTDINEEVLSHARQGVYGPWSFRMVDPRLRQRYFREHAGGFEIDPRVRSMVYFRHLNLRRDPFPDPDAGLSEIDLILCRNVFIYFDRGAVATVLDQFARTLSQDGYLMTGHAELHDQPMALFRARTFPTSVVYQRADAPTTGVLPAHPAPRALPPVPAPPALPQGMARPRPVVTSTVIAPAALARASAAPAPRPVVPSAAPEGAVSRAEALLRAGDSGRALTALEPVLAREPRHHAALCLAAQAYANLGAHDRAAVACRQAIAVNSLSSAPYRLLAAIAEERGDLEAAKDFLKKLLYLAPSSPSAYIELGAIYAREGDAARARKMRASALALLRSADPESSVAECGDLTARELAAHLEPLLAEGP